jgi:hypothetical protein
MALCSGCDPSAWRLGLQSIDRAEETRCPRRNGLYIGSLREVGGNVSRLKDEHIVEKLRGTPAG